MSGHNNSIRVMLRLNLNDPRMVRAKVILEEGVRQERYKSKSHMIVDALLKTFGKADDATIPTMDAIRAVLREEMQSARLMALSTETMTDTTAGNDAEDDAAILDFIGNLG